MKKKYIIKLFIIILIIIFCRLSYMVQFYNRFNSEYNKGYAVYVATARRSPDDMYEITVALLCSENRIKYISIDIRDKKNPNGKEPPLLYLDKWKYDNLVMEDNVPIQFQNGSLKIDEFILLKWLDNETIQIEDKILNVKYDTYDFRKDW